MDSTTAIATSPSSSTTATAPADLADGGSRKRPQPTVTPDQQHLPLAKRPRPVQAANRPTYSKSSDQELQIPLPPIPPAMKFLRVHVGDDIFEATFATFTCSVRTAMNVDDSRWVDFNNMAAWFYYMQIPNVGYFATMAENMPVLQFHESVSWNLAAKKIFSSGDAYFKKDGWGRQNLHVRQVDMEAPNAQASNGGGQT